MIVNSTLACSPIVPLVFLFGWPLVSLLGVVFLKSLWFVRIGLNKGFSGSTSFGAMLTGNIVSTVIGFFPVMAASSPMVILIILPIIFLLSLPPARRLHKLSSLQIWQRISPLTIALVITLLFFLCFIFWGASQDMPETSGEVITYWLTKLAYIYCGLAVTFFLTALWEEIVVGVILKSYFLPEILRMNLYIMLVVWLIFALSVLPERLRQPDFLIFY